MSDHLRGAIEELQSEISERLKEIAGMKQAVNQLCAVLKIDPIYHETEQEGDGPVSPARADAYYGKPLSTAAREYLEFRKKACAAEDILAGLQQGGFDFDAIGWKGEHRLRSLASSLSKNTAIFRRLPNGMFGLKAWYPEAPPVARRSRGRAESDGEQPAQAQPDATPEQSGPQPTYVDDEALQLDQETEAGSVTETTEPASEA